MAWHAAGTYRVSDGRGGAGRAMQLFAPLNSWPDNGNLDKARRLLEPVKLKYGASLSWGDLIVFAGNRAYIVAGFDKIIGFGGGRVDATSSLDQLVYWGPENDKEFLTGDKRYHGEHELEGPLGASEMGLIYVNPEGPGGEPDPLRAAVDIRETFGRMAMNDEETVALIAGGHALGKTHGAGSKSQVGPPPEEAPITAQGLGWICSNGGTGKGRNAITAGPEVTWTSTPTKWSMNYLEYLWKYDWEKVKSPADAWQWQPKDGAGANTVPDPETGELNRPPTMLTTDISLKVDPEYAKISKRFLENQSEFEEIFARAWFKLTHRDMGPKERYLGPLVPKEDFAFQDPIPPLKHTLPGAADLVMLKDKILASPLTVSQLVFTAWAAASTYRDSDKRGGANGGRIRLEPQRSWAANDINMIGPVITELERLQKEYNESRPEYGISFADLVVLGGTAAVEKASGCTLPFTPGRRDATQEQTDQKSMAHLEPHMDGFRNYMNPDKQRLPAEHHLVDRANLLSLTAPEMAVLVAGLRVLGANHNDSRAGVFTDAVGKLSNDFFVNLLDMNIVWSEAPGTHDLFEGRSRADGQLRYTASRVDLIFGSHPELRYIAQTYASRDAGTKFKADFCAAWTKVMNLDMF